MVCENREFGECTRRVGGIRAAERMANELYSLELIKFKGRQGSGIHREDTRLTKELLFFFWRSLWNMPFPFLPK